MQTGLKILYNIQVGLNPVGEGAAEQGVLKSMLLLSLLNDKDLMQFFPTYKKFGLW